MRVALVSLPWSMLTQPSAALGALTAWIRREAPSIELTARYEYVKVAGRIGFQLYDGLAHMKHELGELLYVPLLYPENEAVVRAAFVEWAEAKLGAVDPRYFGPGVKSFADLYDWVARNLREHLDGLAAELAGSDVVAMTTCYGQYFPNLALATRVKARSPSTRVVLGGSTVSARVGPSTLREYPAVDFVVQGEGERPFLALLGALERGEPVRCRGVLGRGEAVAPDGAELWEVGNMDDLPVPDYREYVDAMGRFRLDWSLPVEGSRGCWWDRTKRHGNARSTCYFCNLNVQWGGYRQKSIDRLIDELKELSDRYATTRVYFLDNIIRHDAAGTLAERIAGLGRDFALFYEMRASVTPHEILLLWEAGLREAQVGVEGLSTAYLRRVGKGTTAIQNLQIMKICGELGIDHGANLIVDFPGSTEAEVKETVDTIQRFAVGLQPLSPCPFHLAIDSTVDKLRADFGLTNVRNRDCFRGALPEDVYRRVDLFDLSFDAPRADWAPVKKACEEWAARHPPGAEKLLVYQDGATFLRITDKRKGLRLPVLRGSSREIYLYCTETRTLDRIVARFGRRDGDRERLRAFLDRLVAEDLMFHEDGRYLAMAQAPTPEAAARRIRRLHDEEVAAASVAASVKTAGPKRLQVVS